MAGNLERRLTVKMSADGVGDVTAALKRVAGSVTGVGRGLNDIKAAAAAARSSLSAIGSAAKNIGKIGALAGAGMTAAGGGLLALTRQVTSDVAERQKLATQLGLSFENYQSLAALAQKYGIEYADMQGFLVNLTDKAYDAAINANETAAGDLAALGVSAVNANGELKTTWELIQSIFDGVAAMKDGSAKAGALSIVAGDEGPRWINILNEGSSALEKQRIELKRTGALISDQQAALALDTDRQYNSLMNYVVATRNRIGLIFAPETLEGLRELETLLNDNREQIVLFVRSGWTTARQQVTELYNALTGKGSATTPWIVNAIAIIRDLKTLLFGTGAPLQSPIFVGIKRNFDDLGLWVDEQKKGIEDLWTVLSGGDGQITTAWVKEAQPDIEKFSSGVMKGIEDIRGMATAFRLVATDIHNAYVKFLEPPLTVLHGLLEKIALSLSGILKSFDISATDAGELAVLVLIGRVTGAFAAMAAAARLAMSAGKAALAIGTGTAAAGAGGVGAGAAGVRIGATAARAAGVAVRASGAAAGVAGVYWLAGQSQEASEAADLAAERGKAIGEKYGEAAQAAYARVFMRQNRAAVGASSILNNVLSFVGAADAQPSVEEMKAVLDKAIIADPAAAQIGLKAAFRDFGPVDLADLGIEGLTLPVEGLQISPSVDAELQSISAGIRIESAEISKSVRDQLSTAFSASLNGQTQAVPGFSVGGSVWKRMRGLISGPGTETSDSVPALLSRREYVQNASAVRFWGVGLMDALNSRNVRGVARLLRLPALATGGMISRPSYAPALSGVSAISGAGFGSPSAPVHLHWPDGSETKLTGSRDALADLETRLRRATTAQICRKPSSYK